MGTDRAPAPAEQHVWCWEQIPWFVNGTLDAHEVHAVTDHLARCPTCSREVAEQRRLAHALDDQGPFEVPLETAWAEARSLIENQALIENRIRETVARAATSGADGRRRRPRTFAAAYPPSAISRAALVVLMLAAVVLWPSTPDEPGSRYATMTTPPGSARELRVVVVGSSAPAAVAALFDDLDLHVVTGPTEAGVYTLRAASPEDADRAAAALATSPGILFVAGRSRR